MHHVLKRRYDKKNESVVPLCRDCHIFIENNPKQAMKEGLWKARGSNHE
jgi:hypothetical protein